MKKYLFCILGLSLQAHAEQRNVEKEESGYSVYIGGGIAMERMTYQIEGDADPDGPVGRIPFSFKSTGIPVVPQMHIGTRYDFEKLFCALELGTDLRKHSRQREHDQDPQDLEPFIIRQSRERSIDMLLKVGYSSAPFSTYFVGGVWYVKDIYSVSFVHRCFDYGDASFTKSGIKPVYGVGMDYKMSKNCSIYVNALVKRTPSFSVVCPGIVDVDEDNSYRKYNAKGRNQVEIRLGLNIYWALK